MPEPNNQRFLEAGGWKLDRFDRKIRSADRSVALTGQEFKLAEALMLHSPEPMSRQRLLREAWGIEHNTKTNVLDVYVNYLRMKTTERFIRTERKVGYSVPLETR